MKVLRQGDVLVFEVIAIPKAAQKETTKGDIILAFGEVTGHSHRINTPAKKAVMWAAGAERFLQAMETVSLQHEEHATVTIPPGNYKIVIQQEYRPGELRSVQD